MKSSVIIVFLIILVNSFVTQQATAQKKVISDTPLKN